MILITQNGYYKKVIKLRTNMKKLLKDWEFNVLGIDNYNKIGKLKPYYDFIKNNHNSIDGDICEIGVYRGFSLLATAMLLKEIGSSKIVYGYDSFMGFPSYHENDDLNKFETLYFNGLISQEHYNDFKLNLSYKNLISNVKIDATNISSSGDFSNNSLTLLEKKINFLGLDNIKLVKGDFKDTMTNQKEIDNQIFFAGLVDCDLYMGYKTSLPFLYEKLNRNGYVYLDEYYSLKFPGAKIASDEFFSSKKEKPLMHEKVNGDFERWYFIKE